MCFNMPESARLVVRMKSLVSFQQVCIGLNLGVSGPQLDEARAAGILSLTHHCPVKPDAVPTAVACVPISGQSADNSSAKMRCSGSGSACCSD